MAERIVIRKWSKRLVGLLLIGCLGFLVSVPFRRTVEFNIGDTAISLRFQSLGPNGRFDDDGLFINDSWDGPTGSFSRGKMFGLNFGSHVLRLDVVNDPIAAAQRRLPGTLPGLIKAIDSNDRWLRFCALKVLANMGASARPALPALVTASERGDPAAHDTLLVVSKAVGADAVPVLTNALASPKAAMREKVAEILGEMGEAATEAVPSLVSRFADKEPRVTLQSAYALRKVDGRTHGGVRTLVALLSNPDCEVRAGSAAVLGEFGEQSAEAAPALIKALGDTNQQVRAMSARALGMIGSPARSSIPLLIEQLIDADPTVLMWTALALRDFGEDALSAIPKLTELAMRNEEAARFSIEALATMGTNAGPALARIYRDATARQRYFAAQSLIELGPRGSAALPVVLEELNREEANRVALTAHVVGHMGSDARVAVPRLAELLATDHERLRIRVAGALWRLDRQTNVVLRVLLDALRDDTIENSGARRYAAEELAEMGPAAQEATPLLEAIAYGPQTSLREVAIKALNAIAPRRAN